MVMTEHREDHGDPCGLAPSTVAFICPLPGAELRLVAVAQGRGIYLGTAVVGGKLIPKGKPAWRAMLWRWEVQKCK